MKMGVVSMIRDEADIVHAFLDHLAAFFDVAYLLDHRSADGTSQVLERAAANHSGWKYTRLDFSAYHQQAVSNFFMKKAFEEAKVDCLFFLDADEFLSAPTREELVEHLARTLSAKAIGACYWRNCCPGDFSQTQFDVGNDVWVSPKVSEYKKLIIPRQAYAEFGRRLRICQGNHEIEPLGEEISYVTACDLFHVPIRSLRQISRKVIVGAMSYLAKAGSLSDQGFHWFALLDQIASGTVDEKSLIHLAAKYGEHPGRLGKSSFESLHEEGYQRRPFLVAQADAASADATDSEIDGEIDDLRLIAASLRQWSREDSRIFSLSLDGDRLHVVPGIAPLPPLDLDRDDDIGMAANRAEDGTPSDAAAPRHDLRVNREPAVSAEPHFDPLRETEDFLMAAPALPADDERVPSAWAAHIPLMHCLVRYMRPRRFVELGSHYGASFFAACRTVRESGSATECIAIDTWQGDEHSEKYPEAVFQQFHQRVDRSYRDFASFIRARFEEAVDSFPDGSIDLLHIDGYHTYDAVANDFETWLPKMSDAGVIIMHDTCVRTGTFGVYRFFDELARQFTCVNVAHDHGLGIVAVGKAPTRTRKLIEAWAANENLAAMVVAFFKCAGFFNQRCGELEERKISLERTASQNAGQLVAPTEVQVRPTEVVLPHSFASAESTISYLHQRIAERDEQVAAFLRSRSWRVTRPLRAVTGMVRKLRKSA